MPVRMWRHGIHAFLDILRQEFLDTLDHILAFGYIASFMMALLYESVLTFKDVWIEYRHDPVQYNIAVEDDDIRDRGTWSGVARFWYGRATKRPSTVGSPYHHLAILARSHTLQQLNVLAGTEKRHKRPRTAARLLDTDGTSVLWSIGRHTDHKSIVSYSTCKQLWQGFLYNDFLIDQMQAILAPCHSTTKDCFQPLLYWTSSRITNNVYTLVYVPLIFIYSLIIIEDDVEAFCEILSVEFLSSFNGLSRLEVILFKAPRTLERGTFRLLYSKRVHCASLCTIIYWPSGTSRKLACQTLWNGRQALTRWKWTLSWH